MHDFVDFGSNPDILYDNLPHIGIDVLRQLLINFRYNLLSRGVKIYYETKLIDIMDGYIITDNEDYKEIDYDELILATGHSAFDIYKLFPWS